MRSFWISLLVFCLLMCGCKTKKLDSNVRVRNDVRSELAYLNESVKIDTSKTAYFVKATQNIVIEEDIIETEYDKESGKPIKETKTKRTITQDSDKVVASEEERRVYEVMNDSVNHIVDVNEMVSAEVEEKSENQGFGSAWEKFGEVMGLGTLIVIAYLCWKLKSRVN